MPWVVCGDFNEITLADEKLGWLDRDANQMWDFRECLSKCGLVDLGFVGQRYTWCNGRLGDQRTLVRLDRVVANEAWRCMFSEASAHHLAMSASDHCMIVLYLKRKMPRRPAKRRFMFEAMWTRDERCRQIIEDAWDPLRADTEFQIHERLKSCQDHLQRWNKEVFGNVNKTLRVKQQQLQEIEALNMLHETAEEIEVLRKEINEILVKQEVMRSQRSRALWMKCGDRNTKFFHATATQRQRKNRIEGLWGADGMWQEEKERVEEIILEYFEKIYSTEHTSEYEVKVEDVERCITPEMNKHLLETFRAEEVRYALNQMHPTKSPGPDGMSPLFYQNYWEVVGPYVTKCVLQILNSGSLPYVLNETYICLIPKVQCP